MFFFFSFFFLISFCQYLVDFVLHNLNFTDEWLMKFILWAILLKKKK